jgi:hypothetical protein
MVVRFLKTNRPKKEVPTIDARWADLYVDEEKRRHERLAVKLPISITAMDDRQQTFSEKTSTENVSLSGMYIRTSAAVLVNSSVEVSISTGDAGNTLLPNEFHGIGNVVRISAAPDGLNGLAIALDEHLQQNLEFAVFLNAQTPSDDATG